jgi:hypothetical protein
MTLIMIIFMISVLYKVKAFGAAHVKVSKEQVAEHRPDRAVRRRRLRCEGRRPERGDFEIIFAAANAQAARPVARFPSPDPGSAFFSATARPLVVPSFRRTVQAYSTLPSINIMHSLQALALMQEKRKASEAS